MCFNFSNLFLNSVVSQICNYSKHDSFYTTLRSRFLSVTMTQAQISLNLLLSLAFSNWQCSSVLPFWVPYTQGWDVISFPDHCLLVFLDTHCLLALTCDHAVLGPLSHWGNVAITGVLSSVVDSLLKLRMCVFPMITLLLSRAPVIQTAAYGWGSSSNTFVWDASTVLLNYIFGFLVC